LIRRKIWIDAHGPLETVYTLFRNHICAGAETCRSPFGSIERGTAAEKQLGDTLFSRSYGRLSVRLMSL
jgi:hypothetical protein